MWPVLGDHYLPIAPIDEFLTFHDVTGSSPNTIRAYAHHLKLYWEYLTDADLDWQAATLQNVIDFVTWLRWGSRLEVTSSVGEKRRPSTINAILAAVTAFRVYHVRAGTMAGQIEYQLQMEPGRPLQAVSTSRHQRPAHPDARGQDQKPRPASKDAQRRRLEARDGSLPPLARQVSDSPSRRDGHADRPGAGLAPF
jgi:hypothetical protein